MAKQIWSVLSKFALIDEATKNVSLIEALEEITVTPGPTDSIPPDNWVALPQPAVLTVYLQRSNLDIPERAEVKVEIISSTGEISPHVVSGQIDLVTSKRIRVTIKFATLPFRGFGVQIFAVSIRADTMSPWERVSETPLEIKLGEGPTVEATSKSVRTGKKPSTKKRLA